MAGWVAEKKEKKKELSTGDEVACLRGREERLKKEGGGTGIDGRRRSRRKVPASLRAT